MIYGNYFLELYDINSKYFENGDIKLNLDLLDPNSNNILYITGISGGGKTTLGVDIQNNYNWKRVELDYIAVYYMRKCKERNKYKNFYSRLEKDCPEAVEFFDTHIPEKDYTLRETWADTKDILKDFMDFFVSKVYSNGQIYIVNGSYLFEVYPPEYFKDKPLIFKDVNWLKTALRRSYRELNVNNNINDIISAAKAFKVALKPTYIQANRDAKKYQNALKKLEVI